MNTLKYASEHIDGVEGLLRRENNRVDLPSDAEVTVRTRYVQDSDGNRDRREDV